jgi:hypothetical protein
VAATTSKASVPSDATPSISFSSVDSTRASTYVMSHYRGVRASRAEGCVHYAKDAQRGQEGELKAEMLCSRLHRCTKER